MSALLDSPPEWSRLCVGTSQHFRVSAVSLTFGEILIIFCSCNLWSVAVERSGAAGRVG
jgi:hypothetical protein